MPGVWGDFRAPSYRSGTWSLQDPVGVLLGNRDYEPEPIGYGPMSRRWCLCRAQYSLGLHTRRSAGGARTVIRYGSDLEESTFLVRSGKVSSRDLRWPTIRSAAQVSPQFGLPKVGKGWKAYRFPFLHAGSILGLPAGPSVEILLHRFPKGAETGERGELNGTKVSL